MEQVIQFSEHEEAKALPVLLRHSPGTVLPNRIYILDSAAVYALQRAGIEFRELTRAGAAASTEGVMRGERL